MDQVEFNRLMEGQFTRCKNMILKKGEDYANPLTTHDRLFQPKASAVLQGCSSIRALSGEMAKHTTKLYDYIQRCEKDDCVSQAKWDEVITDHLNYLIILNAMLRED